MKAELISVKNKLYSLRICLELSEEMSALSSNENPGVVEEVRNIPGERA